MYFAAHVLLMLSNSDIKSEKVISGIKNNIDLHYNS